MQPDTMRATFIQSALKAGEVILNVRESCDFNASFKADLSPVTIADQRAETIILDALKAAFPNVPIIAEEQAAAGVLPTQSQTFFLIDPLDGTKEFLSQKDDFTVNIAYIEHGTPVMGIVYAPALKVAWIGYGDTCEKLTIGDDFTIQKVEPIYGRVRPINLLAVISRSHCNAKTEEFIAEHGLIDSVSVGSSLKFCMLAEGLADVYPRFSRTMQWDTGAGDAVLRAAGGISLMMDGQPLQYGIHCNPLDQLANPDFIAWGRKE